MGCDAMVLLQNTFVQDFNYELLQEDLSAFLHGRTPQHS